MVISFPKLRISHLAFGHVLVPLLELFYAHVGSGSLPTALTMLRLLPLIAIAVMFPNIVYHDLVSVLMGPVYALCIIMPLRLTSVGIAGRRPAAVRVVPLRREPRGGGGYGNCE